MVKYDPDRIAALAAGSLDPAEAAVLEAEIAADPRAAAELAAQRLALEVIRRAPAPVLSADERTELRRAVAAALHLEDSPQPAAAAVIARRRLAWRPLAVAAAALAALVVAVPLFGLLSAGDDEAAMTTVAIASTSELRDGSLATTGGDGLENYTSETGQEGISMLGGPTTAAATTTTVPAATGFGERARTDADEAVAALIAEPAPLFAVPTTDQPVPCRDEAQILLEDDDPASLLLDWGAANLAIWFLPGDGADVRRLVAFNPTTCEFLAAYP